jgi:serine/threonine-protein kinase
MGVVYKAIQLSLQRIVALKVIRHDLATHEDYRERFLREAHLAAAVNHPHVVSVYDVIDTNGQLALVMQWVEGETLRHRLTRAGALRPGKAVALAQQLGSALDAVHHAGMVHRDVKPANVLLTTVSNQDHAYLTDFGIASAGTLPGTAGHAAVGTAGYMAPEQITGHGVERSSDLYAMACVVFEMLAGTRPFAGGDDAALSNAHVAAPRPLLSELNHDMDDRFDTVLLRALSIDPSNRFESGRALTEALAASLSVRTTTATRNRETGER